MKRRDFVFGSLKAMILLNPVLSLRLASAQSANRIKRAMFWMQCNGYSTASDFFPSQAGTNFTMSPILQPIADLRGDMVIVNGINLPDGGFKPKGNNHVCSPAKLFSGYNGVGDVGNGEDGSHLGPSVDHIIAQRLNMRTIEVSIDPRPPRTLRSRPFARGANQPKVAITEPSQVWSNLFGNATPPGQQNNEALEQRLTFLRAKRSVLDDLTGDLTRFRRELAGDTEKLKLDIHEDAIRRAELSVAEDIRQTEAAVPPPSLCAFPDNPGTLDTLIPTRARAHMDLLFAAYVCDLVQVTGVVWGWSGYRWLYDWVPGTNFTNYHEEVAHGNIRDQWLLGHRWDWSQLGAFARRLKETPDGSSNMLDTSLILGMNHFGRHHRITQIPTVIFGGSAGGLQTGRNIILPSAQLNDRLLTSVANYMGADIRGLGSNPNCGPLPGL